MNASSSAALVLAVMLLIFLSDKTGNRLPDHYLPWISAYGVDLRRKILLSFAKDPSLVTDTTLERIHYTYCRPLSNRQLCEDNAILFVRDLFNDDDKYTVAIRSSSLEKD